MWQCHIILFFGFAATGVMWQRHIMHSMDLVQPELAGIKRAIVNEDEIRSSEDLQEDFLKIF